MTRRFALTSAIISLIAVLSGCAQQEPSATSSATPGGAPSPAATTAGTEPASGSMKAALITPGKISDNWSKSAYDGLKKIESDLKAQVTEPVEGPAQAQVESVMREAAQEGATIVFGHASEYDDAAKAVSTQFPKTYFVVMGGKSSGPNLVPIQLQSQQATYIAGMLAGGMTKTNKIGLVGGVELPIIKQAFQAFANGAKAVNPKVEVKTTFTGSFDDIAKAKQQAQALLDGGADVLMHNANDAGQGVFQAVEGKPTAFIIGANSDQNAFVTAQNLGSFILDVPAAMLSVAKAIQEGKTEGKPFAAGLKEGAVSFLYNPKFAGKVPDDLKAKIQKAEEAMKAGTLDPLKG